MYARAALVVELLVTIKNVALMVVEGHVVRVPNVRRVAPQASASVSMSVLKMQPSVQTMAIKSVSRIRAFAAIGPSRSNVRMGKNVQTASVVHLSALAKSVVVMDVVGAVEVVNLDA